MASIAVAWLCLETRRNAMSKGQMLQGLRAVPWGVFIELKHSGLLRVVKQRLLRVVKNDLAPNIRARCGLPSIGEC